MPGNLKLELLKEGRTNWPEIPLIVITGAPSLPTAIEGVRLGITDYLLKPVKLEDLLSSIRRALAHRDRTKGAKSAPPSKLDRNRFPEIIGDSPPMQELFEIIERVANTDTNVLVTGESGTGKEAVARAIHRLSERRRDHSKSSTARLFPKHCLNRSSLGIRVVRSPAPLRIKPGC